MTIILATLTFTALVSWRLFRKRVHGPMTPTSNATALWLWDQRFDREYPKDSEERLALAARGAVAKRRIMAHMRNAAAVRARLDAKRTVSADPTLFLTPALQRIGDGPLTTVYLLVEPLASLRQAKPAVVPVIVRRPVLSLARGAA